MILMILYLDAIWGRGFGFLRDSPHSHGILKILSNEKCKNISDSDLHNLTIFSIFLAITLDI